MKLFLLYIIACTFFIVYAGCKKDKSLFLGEFHYQTDSKANVAGVKMFTRSGELKDKTIIQTFLQRHDSLHIFFLNDTVVSISPNLLQLILEPQNKASFSKNSLPFTPAEVVASSTTSMLIAAIDSTENYLPLVSSHCDTIKKFAFQIIPPATTYSLPPSSGYAGMEKYRFTFPLEGNNKNYKLPLLSIFIYSANHNDSCSTLAIDEWNVFNNQSFLQLKAGDTLLCQAKQVNLFKQ